MTPAVSPVPRLRRALAGAVLALLSAGLLPAPTAAAAPSTASASTAATAPSAAAPRLSGRPAPGWAVRPPSRTLVAVSRVARLAVYTQPRLRSPVLIRLAHPTPQGFPLVLAALGADPSGRFLRVLLPVRPNQTYGWVKAGDVTTTADPWRIEISQRRHTLLLWRGRVVVGSFPVATGTGGTPTPNGYFFLNAVLPQRVPGGDYGPVILSTSGFSEVYATFAGGEAAIGIHGTAQRNSVGTSASHGCIRMHNEDVALLARTVAVGTLVSVHP